MNAADTANGSQTRLRRLLNLSRSEWPRLAAGTVFLLLGSGAGLLVPQALRVLIDRAVDSGDPGIVDRTALVMGGILAVQAVAVALRYVLFTTAGERIVATLRESLFAAILRQEVAFFDARRTGELINRLSADTTVVQNAVSVNVSMALRSLAMALGGIAFMGWTSPQLTILMLVVVPPVAVGAVVYGRRIRRLSRRVQDALADASGVAEQAISGIRTVRSFAAEPVEGDRYDHEVERSFELSRSRIRTTGGFLGVSSFAGMVSAVVVLWWGGRLVLAGGMTVGGLTAFLVYTLLVAMSLGTLSGLWADFARALGAAQRIFELIDRSPTMPWADGLAPDERPETLALEGVHFTYPTRPDVEVLTGIDLAARRGEVIALVGPSGAGKSTIAALVGRLYDPDSGRVTFDGRDARDLDPNWLRGHVGVVAQEPILFSESVAENIRYARPDASDAEVEAAARAANAHDFVTDFPDAYATLVGERGVQLSGGQKQRVAIARAMLKDPAVLVLDEATSALDAESEHLVKDALDRLMKGRITLVIAHRLSTVADADRVAVLDGGKVVQMGPHDQLVGDDGLYRRLIERQFVAA